MIEQGADETSNLKLSIWVGTVFHYLGDSHPSYIMGYFKLARRFNRDFMYLITVFLGLPTCFLINISMYYLASIDIPYWYLSKYLLDRFEG